MAVLVTGVGYLGAALAARLLRAGERVVGLDNGFATDLAAVERLAALGDFTLVRGSVTAPRAVARAFGLGRFDVVYHLAAQASAPVAARRPRYTEITNLTGPRIVLDAAARHAVPRVVYGSSLRVYGPVLPPLVDESTRYGPQTDLAHLSHVYGEKLLELYARRHVVTAIAVRLAVVYGAGPVTRTDYAYMTVPNKFCLQAVRGEGLAIYPGAATPTAFIHLDDACAALQVAAASPWPVGFHAANAAGEVCTVPEVAALVVAAAETRGIAVAVQRLPAPDQPPQPPNNGGSPTFGPDTDSANKGGGGAASTAAGGRKTRPYEVYAAGALGASPPGHEPAAASGQATSAPKGNPAGAGGQATSSPDSPDYWGAGGAAPDTAPVVLSRLTALGWRPTRTLADTVGELIDYFRQREAP